MRKRIRQAMVKLLALVLVLILTFPSEIVAQSLNGEQREIYTKDSSLMGVNEKDEDPNSRDKSAQNEKTLLQSNILKENLEKLDIKKSVSLSKTTGEIIYKILIKNKENNKEEKLGNLQTIFALNKNSKQNDLHIQKITSFDENGNEVEIDATENQPFFQSDEIKTLSSTCKVDNSVLYYLSSKIDDKTLEEIRAGENYQFALDLLIKNENQEILHQERLAFRNIDKSEENLLDPENPEIIDQENQAFDFDLEFIEDIFQVAGEYKDNSKNLLADKTNEINWTDFIFPKYDENNEALNYKLIVDENQDTTDSLIKVDFYEASDEGFVINKTYSQEIPYTEETELQIPQGFIAKIALTTKVKEGANPKEFSYNNKIITNPSYKEENEKIEEEKKENSEDPLPEEKNEEEKPAEDKKPSTEIKVDDKASEEDKTSQENKSDQENKDGKTSDTQLVVTDADGNEIPVEEKENQTSPIDLNKDALINKYQSEEKLSEDLKAQIEEITKTLNSYNKEKISEEEFKINLKENSKDLKKEELKEILQSLIAGLNEEKFKVANLPIDEIIADIYKEDLKEEKSDLEKAEDKKEEQNKNDSSEEKPAEKSSETTVDDKKTEEKEAETKENKGLMQNLSDGLKSLFSNNTSTKDLSNYERADKELKAAIKASKSLEEIQDLLHELEEKYSLNEEDQEKLMTSNNEAILDLVEKHRKGNTFLNFFRANESDPLYGKHFTVKTFFQTNTALDPIAVGQYFKIRLDKKLTVDPVDRTIDPIRDPRTGDIIATGQYLPTENAIWYKVVKPIKENLNLPLNIDVEYNIDEIRKTIPQDQTFVVENFVTGFGVVNPRSLGKFKVDTDGTTIGNAIDEGDHPDVDQIFENGSNYRVEMQANSSPVVENGKLTAIDWTVNFFSDQNLKDPAIDLRTNFTIVDGSGFDKIEQIYLNGQAINTEINNMNEKGEKFLIKDSKHHKADRDGKSYTYTFRTKVTDPQSVYTLDIAAYLAGKNKSGAVRLISQGYPEAMLQDLTPNRTSANNRTTIKGEFKSNQSMSWKITDEVSSGDDGSLPLAKRSLSDSQLANTTKFVKTTYYGLNSEGKMEQKVSPYTLSSIPDKGTVPTDNQPAGTIAVYQIDTIDSTSSSDDTYELGGVKISLYQDLKAKMKWMLPTGPTPPETTITTKTGTNNTKQTQVTVGQNSQGAYEKDFTISDVQVWNINNSKPEKLTPSFNQTFNPESKQIGSTTYTFAEKEIYYDTHDKKYIISNTANENTQEKPGFITILKTDEDGNPLSGAEFSLSGTGGKREHITTGADGRVRVSNITPGSYTLLETKAPVGYKLESNPTVVKVNSQGGVNKTEDIPTKYLTANNGKPGFMNTYDYAKVSQDKKTIDYYIYLKPVSNDPPNYNSTDRDTRLFLNMTGANIRETDMYDVSPDDRAKVKKAMEDQNVESIINGLTSVKNVPNQNGAINETIGLDSYVDNQYNEGRGYSYKIPQKRITNNWGFLVKVSANITSGATSVNPRFYWLCDFPYVDQVKDNWKIERRDLNVILGQDNNPENLFTFTNKKFPSQDVELVKIDRNGRPLKGVEFTLLTMDGDQVAKKVSDDQGKINFGKVSPGTYELFETQALDGYFKTPVHFHVKVSEGGLVSFEGLDENEAPVGPGTRYWIDQKQINDPGSLKPHVTVTDTSITLREKGTGRIPDVWEGFEFETFDFKTHINMTSVVPGQTLDIKLDSRWDLSRLLNDQLPEIKDKTSGAVIASAYLDKRTNLITYVFNEKAASASVDMDLEIVGLYPSPYFVRNNYEEVTFENIINASGKNPYIYKNTFKSYYGEYLVHGTTGLKQYPGIKHAISDTYVNPDKSLSSRAVFYYNPLAEKDDLGTNKINIDWESVDQGTSDDVSIRNRYGKPMELRRVRVYRVDGMNAKGTHEHLMPQSMGVKPSEDPANYTLIADFDIGNNRTHRSEQSNVYLDYDFNRKYSGMIYKQAEQSAPLNVQLPKISQREGYIIETYFDVTNKRLYQDYYRQVTMEVVGSGNARASRIFTQKAGTVAGQSEQTEIEIPKIYTQILKVINESYTPGRFELTKIDQITRKPIDGVSFILSDIYGNTTIKKSDTNGKIYFDNLRPGSYTLQEGQPKKGYTFTDKKWSIDVDSTGRTIIRRVSFEDEEVITDGNLIVENKPIGIGFKLFKQGEKGNALGGAKFKLTKDGDTNFNQEKSSDSKNGEVAFDNMTEGTYYLEEIEAPAGYTKTDKKYKIVVDKDGKAHIYLVKDSQGTTKQKFDLMNGMKTVDVMSRATSTWRKDTYNRDERYYDYAYSSNTPNQLGTRIIGIDKDKKTFVQRFVINPEAGIINQEVLAYIRRDRAGINENTNWYEEDGTLNSSYINIYTLDKPVEGKVADIVVNENTTTNVTSLFHGTIDNSTEPNRLQLSLLEDGVDPKDLTGDDLAAYKAKLDKLSYKPIVVEVKSSYDDNDAEIGLGMYSQLNGWWAFKRDFYEMANDVVEAQEEGNISFEYVGENSLILKNDRIKTKFKLKKISDSEKLIEGAVFSLEGKGDNPYPKTEGITGKDGTLTFDGLTAGEYILKEVSPAPGYEPQGEGKYWVLTVTADSTSPDGYKMKLVDQDGNGPSNPPTPPEPGTEKLSLSGSPKTLNPQDLFQDTGIKIKNRDQTDTSILIVDEDPKYLQPEFRTNPDGSESIWINPTANVDGPITLTIKDKDLVSDTNPDGQVTYTINIDGHSKGVDDNQSNKLEIDSIGQHFIDPDQRKQGTGIILKNTYRTYNIEAKDEDGTKVPYSVNAQTGEIELTPPANVDGPISLTVSSPDLPGNSWTTSVGVNGHSLDADDNYSDFYVYKAFSDDQWLPPVSTDWQDSSYRLYNTKGRKLGTDYTLSFVDEDGKTDIPYHVNSDGTIGIITAGVDGPITMTLRSKYLKGGSQDFTINIREHQAGVDDNNSDTKVTGQSEIVTRDNTGYYYTGYVITSPNNDYTISVVDEKNNPITFWDGNGNSPARPYVYMYNGNVAIATTTDMDGPLTMTVNSPTLKGNNTFPIHIQDEVVGGEDISQKTYHLEKRENTNLVNITDTQRWKDYMNLKSAVLSGTTNDTNLKARIFLNPWTDATNGKGPNRTTRLTLNKNGATSFTYKVYWVRKSAKGNVNWTAGTIPLNRDVQISPLNNTPPGYGGTLNVSDSSSSVSFDFPKKYNKNDWDGDGFIVEIEATYPNTSLDNTNPQTKHVDYTWITNDNPSQYPDKIVGKLGFEKVEDATRSRSARLFSTRSMDTRDSLLANNNTNLAPIPSRNMSQGLRLAEESLEMSESIKPQAQQAGEDRAPGTPTAAFTFDFDAENKEATIVNKQVGIQLKVNKKNNEGKPLDGVVFKLTRTHTLDENGEYVEDKKEIFDNLSTDAEGKLTSPSLLPGRYELEEISTKDGYVVPPAPWIIEVKEENGRLQIYQRPPGVSPQAYIDANSAATVRPGNHSKIFSYKLVAIDTERRTFTIRMYINPQGIPNDRPYSFDFYPKNFVFADEAEKGAKGVMFNYRTTYRITNPAKYEHRELNLLNLKSDDVELINTARFRPFRYGFTQDLINLKNISQNGGEAVGYVVDLEGSYTDGFFNKNNNQLDIDFWFGEIKQGRFEKGKTSWKNWGEVENIAGTDGTDQYVVKPFQEELVDGTWQPYKNPPEDKVYHMNFDLSDLFTSDTDLPVEDTGMTIYNRDETYNMAFTKYDGEHHDIDVEGTKDKLVRLEGAVFQLQRKELGVYRDMQGYALATAFNGFVGFNNLPPGEYRIIEIKPPRRKVTEIVDGKEVEKYINYRKIEGPVMDFTLKSGSRTVTLDGKTYTRKGDFIITKRHPRYIPTSEVVPSGSGLVDPNEKIVTNPEHEIPDYVTHATQQFGKVLNDEAGLGKIEVNKTGDEGKPLQGATFKVTRISSLGKENTTAVSDQITSDENGFIKFENLPIGNYILEEVSAPPGYEVDRQVRRFTVGGKGNDPYYEVPTPTGRDLSKYIKYDDQKLYHVNDFTKEIGGPSSSQPKGTIDPNNSESLVFVNTFSIDRQQMITDKVGIKAGDQFTIHLSENLDLNGIDTRDQDDLNIIEEGVGTIAHAKYDKETNTITYLFTDFAKFYNLDSFTSTINAYINNKVVKTTSVQKVSMDLNNTDKAKWINVDYSLIRGHTEYGYENLDISTKIVKYNPDTGEFVQYIYVNRDTDSYSNGATFQYEPGKALSDVKIETYPFGAGQVKSTRLPVSFGVDEAWFDENIENKETINVGSMADDDVKDIDLGGPLRNYDAFFIKVTGKVLNDTGNFKPTAWVYNTQYPQIYANTWSYARFEKNIAGAKIDFSVAMPNRKNRLKFEKVDQFNNPVKSAGFKLYKITKKDSTGKPISSTAYTGTPNTFSSNADGSFEIVGLPKGDYGLKEETVPDGYTKVDEWAATFTVDRNGHFTDIKTNYQTGSQQGPVQGENIDDSISIQRIVNEKEFKYKFKKVDKKTQEGIAGAEFELLYRPKEYTVETDQNGNVTKKEEVPWENVKVTQQGSLVNYKVTSAADGLVEFKFKKPGYYQIKEVKAPDGYIQPENGGKVIKEFVLVDGKIKIKTKVRPGLVAKDSSSTDKDSSLMLMTKTDQNGWKYLDTTIEINPDYKTMTFTKDVKLKINYNADVGANVTQAKVYLVGKDEKPSSTNEIAFGEPLWKTNLGMALNIYSYLGGKNDQLVTTDKKLIIKYTNIDLSKDANRDLQIKTTLEGIQGTSENPVATYNFKSSDIITEEEAKDPNYSILVDYEEPKADNSNLEKVENIKEITFKFRKVDGQPDSNGKKQPLGGAVFELWYKANQEDKYAKYDDNTYTSAETTGLVEIKNIQKDGYYAIREKKAPSGYTKVPGNIKEFEVRDGELFIDGAPTNGSFVTKVDVDKKYDWVYTWGFVYCYKTDINIKYNTANMPITYSKGKAKLTLSGLPRKSQPTGDKVSEQGITIYASLTDKNGSTQSKTYNLSLSEYNNNSYASKTIDLYELVKELEGKTGDDDITSSKTLVISMHSDLYKSTELDLGSNIEIGEQGQANAIIDKRTYHIGTKGDENVDHNYTFTNELKIGNSAGDEDIPEVENTKAEYPFTASVGTTIFTAIGLALMVLGVFIYNKRKQVV